MSAGKVNIIARYFEFEHKTGQKQNNKPVTENKDNNNTVCTRPALGPFTNTSAMCSTSTCPEMSSQSGMSAQPMRGQSTGHVTKYDDPQPIDEERARHHGLGDGGSHLRGVIWEDEVHKLLDIFEQFFTNFKVH